MHSSAQFVLRYVLIAACIAAGFYSEILGHAAFLFDQDTAASASEAVRLAPYNATYVARLASWDEAQRISLLKRAAELNPFDSQSLIQLGLNAEMEQEDTKTAESYYLKAADVNHMFLPKWTLTNYYFRRQNSSEFFRWANETLKISPYIGDPVFTQMWLTSQDPGRISAAIPDRARTLIQYAWFLSNAKQFAAVPPIIQRLVRVVGDDDPHAWGRDDLIASSLDRVLAAGDLATGLQIWTTLRDARWIAQGVPTADHPLTNGEMKVPFYRHGFDWMPIEGAGVRLHQYTDTASLETEFWGDEPEHFQLLRQYVAVEPGFLYRLQWHAESQNIPAGSGFAWHLRAASNESATDIASGDLLNAPQTWDFVAPPGVSNFVLVLEYNRVRGYTRPSGHLTLKSVSMTRLP